MKFFWGGPMLWKAEIDPLFIAENENIGYISTDFGHKTVGETELSFKWVGKRKLLIQLSRTLLEIIGPRNPPLFY